MDDDVYPEPDCLGKIVEQMLLQNVQVGIPNRTDKNFDDRAIINFDFDDYHKFSRCCILSVTTVMPNQHAIPIKMGFPPPLINFTTSV